MTFTRRSALVFLNRATLAACGYLALRVTVGFLDAPSARTRARRYLGKLTQVAARAARGGWYLDPDQPVAVVVREQDVQAVSLVCTHLGCTTRPTADERFLECPCHGSRFRFMDGGDPSGLGKVVQGPASEDLARLPVVAVHDDLFLES